MRAGRHFATDVREDAFKDVFGVSLCGSMDVGSRLFALEARFAGVSNGVPPLDLHPFDESTPDHLQDRVRC